MRIVILGAPGSGKKTQTSLLAEKYHLNVVNAGELVKQALAEESERGLQLRLQQQAGQPVTDDVVLGLLQERLVRDDLANGFILDGFPRNLLQALTLDELLDELALPLDFILLFEIETDALMERLVGRRTCRSCAMEYNIYTQPTAVEDICDLCGGRLHQRADDTEETVSNRLHVFDHLTAPLLSHYGKQDKVLRVDGEGEVELVFGRTCEAIDRLVSVKSDAVARAESLAARPEAQSPTAGSQASDTESPSLEKTTVETRTTNAVAKKGVKATAKAASGTPAQARKPAIEKPVASKKPPTVKKAAVQGGKKAPAAGKKVAAKPSVTTGSMAKKTTKQTAVRSSGKKRTAAAKAKPGATKRGADKKTDPKRVDSKKTTGKKSVTKKTVASKAPGTKKKVVPRPTAKKPMAKKKAAKKPAAGKKAARKKASGMT